MVCLVHSGGLTCFSHRFGARNAFLEGTRQHAQQIYYRLQSPDRKMLDRMSQNNDHLQSLVHPVQVAFVTDMGMLRPTLIAACATVQNCSRPVTVHFMGYRLTDKALNSIRTTFDALPNAHLVEHELTADMLQGVGGASKRHLTIPALGRLLLPQLVDGRLLYLDGDIMVTGDVAPLFELDMNGKPVAAVRDIKILRMQLKAETNPKAEQHLQHYLNIMAPENVYNYFNSGVLLLDNNAIREDEQLFERFSDLEASYAFSEFSMDQDYLNNLLKGRVHFLEPGWNCIWGRAGLYRKVWQTIGKQDGPNRRFVPKIVHYTGPNKPWKSPRFSSLSKDLKAFLLYRLHQRRYVKFLTDP